MPAQNFYTISCEPATKRWWLEKKGQVWPGDTWQDAIHNFIDEWWADDDDQVISEQPSEDGKSGSMRIKKCDFLLSTKFTATIEES